MTPIMALFTYAVTWFITMFVFLPVQGLTPKQRVMWNTALAAVATLGIHVVIISGWIQVR